MPVKGMEQAGCGGIRIAAMPGGAIRDENGDWAFVEHVSQDLVENQCIQRRTPAGDPAAEQRVRQHGQYDVRAPAFCRRHLVEPKPARAAGKRKLVIISVSPDFVAGGPGASRQAALRASLQQLVDLLAEM